MSDDEPLKCVLCDEPAVRGSILCAKHRKAARRQTRRLEKEYKELMDEDTEMIWGHSDA